MFNKIKTENIKIHHFKDEILNRNKIKKETHIQHSGSEPGSRAHKSTTLTNELRGFSLQDIKAQNLENAWIGWF